MNEIKCPHDLNQFLIGEPIFENPFPEEECEQRKFYGDCYHCFATAIASRDHQLIKEQSTSAEPCDDSFSKKELLDAIYSSIPSELTPDGRRVVEISTLIDHIAEM